MFQQLVIWFSRSLKGTRTSNIILKSITTTALEGQQSKKIDVWRSWTPPGTMLHLKRHLGGILAWSWQHLGAILGSKIKETRLKSIMKTDLFCWIDVYSIFKGPQMPPKSIPNRWKIDVKNGFEQLTTFWIDVSSFCYGYGIQRNLDFVILFETSCSFL